MDKDKRSDSDEFIMQFQQIDWAWLIGSVLYGIFSYYVIDKVEKKYSLHKECKPKNIKSVTLPPEVTIKYSDIDEKKILSQEYGETVLKFAKFMIDKFSKPQLTIFYNNINELIVSQKIEPKEKRGLAWYHSGKNKIYAEKESLIYHELFHMASSVLKGDIIYSGFHQLILKPKQVSFGDGINEGYTQLLAKRYFNDSAEDGYEYHILIAERLEEIIGQEKMEKLYFNADLLGLINELKKYISEEEIMKFIAATDFIKNYGCKERLTSNEEKTLVQALEITKKILLDIQLVAYSFKYEDILIEADNNLSKYV